MRRLALLFALLCPSPSGSPRAAEIDYYVRALSRSAVWWTADFTIHGKACHRTRPPFTPPFTNP